MSKVTEAKLRAALDTEKITAWLESLPPDQHMRDPNKCNSCSLHDYLAARHIEIRVWHEGFFRDSDSIWEGPIVEATPDCTAFQRAQEELYIRQGYITASQTLALWRKHMYEVPHE